nr:AraC family transcriptional regulator [Lachnospiraceae bacterium]
NFYFNDDKIIDVAFQLSYNEPSYFCKVFKKIEGVTPTFLKNEMTKYQEICPAM